MVHSNASKMAAALVALLGCGDDEHETNARTNQSASVAVAEACGDICDGMRGARCVAIDLSRCEALCAQQYAATPASCQRLADQLLDCASKATFSCGVDGPEATFCRQLEARLDSCSGATAVGDGSATMPPSVDAAALPDVRPDAGVPSQLTSDAALTPASDATSPAQAVEGGRGESDVPRSDAGSVPGAAVLSCEPEAADEPCDRCIKKGCCGALAACGSACQALGGCVAECDSEACLDSCFARNPAGLAAFEAILDCSAESCESECGDDEMPDPGSISGARPPPADKCLPTFAPLGTCSDPSRPVGYDCSSQPFSDCVALPNVHDVYCCGR